MRVLLIIALLAGSLIGHGQTSYYVSNSGNDGNNGTSPGTAWASLAKVQAELGNLAAGNRVLFNRGDVFDGILNILAVNGANNNRITFGSYGIGAKPILSGTKEINGTWTVYSGNIWQLTDNSLPTNVRMLSINGGWKSFGRWPDNSWREYSNAVGKNQFNDLQGLGVADNYWQGAEAVVGVSQYGYIIENLTVNTQTGNTFYTESAYYNIYNGTNHFYYLQNHVKCLNLQDEWAYNSSNHTLYLYSTVNPNSLSIRVTINDEVLTVNNSSYLTFENLVFEGGNLLVVDNASSNNINYNNMEIKQGAYDGIHLTNSNYVNVTACLIDTIGNNGLQIETSNHIVVSDNVFRNIGLDRGAGGIGGNKSVGMTINSGTDCQVRYNEFYNIGYNGITLINYTSFNCSIANNYVHHYCLTKSDGGGIYTWQLNNNHNNGNVIDHNIVVDGQEGTNLGMITGGEIATYPIYCDDRTDYITISNNTCGDGWFSLYLHSASHMTVINNTLYGGEYCIMGIVDANAAIEMVNIQSSNNKLVLKQGSNQGLYFSNIGDELAGGTVSFSNDFIIDPFRSRTTTTAVYSYSSNPPVTNGNHTFTQWDAFSFTTNPVNAPVILSETDANAANFVFFAYNPTKNDSTINLQGTYLDVNGDVSNSSILLEPYESVILFQTESDPCAMSVNATVVNDTNNKGVGSISLSVSGAQLPVSYSWSNASQSQSISGLNAGTYSVTVSGNNGCTSSHSWTIQNNTVSTNHSPVINPQTFTVNESDFSLVIGNVLASEPDAGQSLSYSIVSGNNLNLFALNSSNGQLSFTTSTIDFTNNPNYSLTVRVTDNGTPALSAQALITIKLDDLSNHAPSIENQNFTVEEINFSQTIGIVLATDPDAGQLLNYSIVAGNTQNLFAINASTGQLSFTTNDIDFSNDPDYAITIGVSDNGLPILTAQAQIIISLVEDNSNSKPVVNNQSYTIYQSDTLSAFVGNVLATDSDPDQLLSYFIISGNTEDKFSIDESTGNLYLTSLDIDFHGKLQYVLGIKVEDNGAFKLTDDAEITINLISTDVVFYIDPENSNSSARNGSFQNPFSSWSEVVWQDDAFYMQKRNTSSTEADVLEINATHVTLGAYGEGELPVITSQSADYAIRILHKPFISITNLAIQADNAISCLYILGDESEEIIVDNCRMENAEYGMRIVNAKSVLVSNSTFKNKVDGILAIAEYVEIDYNNFIGNSIAINFGTSTTEAKINNNVFSRNGYGIVATNASTLVFNNIFDLSEVGSIAFDHVRGKIISNNNIFYPEKTGFIRMDGLEYNSLSEYQTGERMDSESLNSNPLFQDVENHNYKTQIGSPAIDAGVYLGILGDMYGTIVPCGLAPDIGSFEAEFSPLSAQSAKNEPASDKIRVYPNPAKSYITIDDVAGESDITRIEILDISGKRIYHSNDYLSQGFSNQTIDLSAIQPGVYLVKVTLEDAAQEIKTIIVQ